MGFVGEVIEVCFLLMKSEERVVDGRGVRGFLLVMVLL